MTDKELYDALDGLYSRAAGFLDSGIHDAQLRSRVIAHLNDDPDVGELRLKLSRFIRDRYLSEEALGLGYGIADVWDFLMWLRDDMGVDEW